MTVTTRTRATRALFHFDWRDGLDKYGNLVARSGQAITFDRGGTAGAATAVDRNGRVYTPGYKSPRFHHRYSATSGLWEPCGVLLEGSRANLAIRSENFGTGWTAIGTPTRAAAAHTASGVSLDLIGDDDAGAVEGYYQPISYTGDDVKAVSLYVKKGTSAPASGSLLQLWDATASAVRGNFTLSWNGTVPSVSASAGTYLGYERLADDVYRLLVDSSAITAGNTNWIVIYPATSLAETGNLYAGGVQAENASFPSAYITTAASIVTRAADAMSAVFNAVPGAMTVYAKFTELGVPNNDYLWAIGTAGVADSIGMYRGTSVNKYGGAHWGVSTRAENADTVPALGTSVETRFVLAADGSVVVGSSLNGAAETANADAATSTLSAAWSASTLYIGNQSGLDNGFSAIQSIKVAAGVQTLAAMRAL